MTFEINHLGGTFGTPRKTELEEYKELKSKRHLSEADQKRLESLKKELEWRGLINSSGEVKGEGTTPITIFDQAQPKSHADYQRYEVFESFKKFYKG